MTSKSYIDFLELLEDVEKLTSTHNDYCKQKAGKKNLGHLTRSGLVMLCAAWERYNENFLLEVVDLVLRTDIEAKALPKEVKQYISSQVKNHKNEIYPIELADSGWKNLWKGYAVNETNLLNTPNAEKLNTLFKRFLGLSEYTELWKKKHISKINEFIKIRGEIAHNGSKSKYVRIRYLLGLVEDVIENIIEVEYNLSKWLENTYNISPPWDGPYYRRLITYTKRKERNLKEAVHTDNIQLTA